MADALTKLSIDALAARARRDQRQQELCDDREPGLRVRAGARSTTWILVSRLQNGKRSRVRLGTWPGMGISAARSAAQAMRETVFQGADPNLDKKEEIRASVLETRRQVVLKDVLDTYESSVLKDHRSGGNTRRSLDGKSGLLTTLLSRPLVSITRLELGDLIKEHAKTAPIGANRKLALASAFFNWCVDEGILEANPIARMRKPSREVERDRFHTLEELAEIWRAAGTLGYPFQQLFQLLIVLPMRREEVAGIPIADLILGPDERPDQAIWTLPAGRTKKGNALRVPLSPLARSIMKEALAHPDRPKDCRFLFSTTGETSVSGFTKAKRRLCAEIEKARASGAAERGISYQESDAMAHWTIHDLRTTFNTHACEILAVPPHVADRILNHVATATRSKIMRVYNKSELFEPRREALNHWAQLLQERVIRPSVAEQQLSVAT
uniref:tyrosine-type recombinase/integrase n=1 Tax=uncultured Sphingomonas sp. TaxID=158754 RepID=UPI0035CAFC48